MKPVRKILSIVLVALLGATIYGLIRIRIADWHSFRKWNSGRSDAWTGCEGESDAANYSAKVGAPADRLGGVAVRAGALRRGDKEMDLACCGGRPRRD